MKKEAFKIIVVVWLLLLTGGVILNAIDTNTVANLMVSDTENLLSLGGQVDELMDLFDRVIISLEKLTTIVGEVMK